MTSEADLHKNEIADNIERTVQRTALRKVRNLADELGAEEAARKRLETRALIIAAVVCSVIMVWFVTDLIASDEKFERGKSVQLPDKVVVPQKE
jgi:hypothetical protein